MLSLLHFKNYVTKVLRHV